MFLCILMMLLLGEHSAHSCLETLGMWSQSQCWEGGGFPSGDDIGWPPDHPPPLSPQAIMKQTWTDK